MQKPARTVLVVEDEPLIRLFLADVLEDAGFAVLEAGSVLEAIAVVGLRRDIDVLFTDVDLPGGPNGIDLAKTVASSRPHVGIIITSGRVEITRSELPLGAEFLPKPYNAIVAVNAVESIIGLARDETALAAS